LPDAIDALLRSAPDLQVELLEAADDRLVAALANKSIDLVIAGAMPPQADIAMVAEIRFGDLMLRSAQAAIPWYNETWSLWATCSQNGGSCRPVALHLAPCLKK